MTKEQFIEWIQVQEGWREDPWGHYQRDLRVKGAFGVEELKTFRFKIGDLGVRYEVKIKFPKGVDLLAEHAEWLRLKSGYYKNLNVTPEGKLRGLKV
jgi:hypothetical protein